MVVMHGGDGPIILAGAIQGDIVSRIVHHLTAEDCRHHFRKIDSHVSLGAAGCSHEEAWKRFSTVAMPKQRVSSANRRHREHIHISTTSGLRMNAIVACI